MTPPERVRVLRLQELSLDTVVAHGGDGEIRFRRVFDRGDFAGPWNFVDYAVVPPGGSIGRHRHGRDEELYLVLEGEGELTLDGVTHRVGPGSVAVNRAGGEHALKNVGATDLRLFVVEVALPDDAERSP